MIPCTHRFGGHHRMERDLPAMVQALRDGGYAPIFDDYGEWAMPDGCAILRHRTNAHPDVRFSSRIGSRPDHGDAVEAAILCLAPDGPCLPIEGADVEIRLDATMRIVAATSSAPSKPGRIRLVHAPTPWSPLRVESSSSSQDREDLVGHGEGADLVPVCTHTMWQSRVDPSSATPVIGLEIEPFHVAIQEGWTPDPMETMRILRGMDGTDDERQHP